MERLRIGSYDEFAQYEGKDLGQSEWLEVTQDRINQFADATSDHQWIHVDPERAKDGPFGQTIAHGYLTLSLLPYLWEQIVDVHNLKMMVNYGMDKMRFGKEVRSGQRIRLVTHLAGIANLRGITKVEIKFHIEIEGERKHALEGLCTFLYYFS
ncbi:MAG: MaoC family dehydratase [Bacteroidaceae bacterium]|nr:MaoC family dehydratase [Bacteroidaceae bacterium]